MDKFLGTQERRYTTLRGGYITLISVLIVGAVGMAVTVSLLLLGVGAIRSSQTLEQSAQARGLADACVEKTLLTIHDAKLCLGSASEVFDIGQCASLVTDNGDGNCEIASTGTVGSVIRRTRVILDSLEPLPNVSAWKEVADF